MTPERGRGKPGSVERGNVDEKKSEGFFFHVSSIKLCLTFEFSPRLTSIKSCQITLKGLELPGETFDCNHTGFPHCSRHSGRTWRRKGRGRAGEGGRAKGRRGGCSSGQRPTTVRLGTEAAPRNVDTPGGWESVKRPKHSKAKGHVIILILANACGGLLQGRHCAGTPTHLKFMTARHCYYSVFEDES